MTPQASGFLAMARDDLEVARRDLAGEYPRHAASRAYYAAFHAAVAGLEERGERTKSHAGVRTQFAKLFVKDGPFDAAHSKTLAGLARLRHDADYEVGRDVPLEVARQAVLEAQAFVADREGWFGES